MCADKKFIKKVSDVADYFLLRKVCFATPITTTRRGKTWGGINYKYKLRYVIISQPIYIKRRVARYYYAAAYRHLICNCREKRYRPRYPETYIAIMPISALAKTCAPRAFYLKIPVRKSQIAQRSGLRTSRRFSPIVTLLRNVRT